MILQFDPPLDPMIEPYVRILCDEGIETFESCDGGKGHAYPEPTIRFHGGAEEGWRAMSVILRNKLPISALRRIWPVIQGEPTGPWWEVTFLAQCTIFKTIRGDVPSEEEMLRIANLIREANTPE